MAKSKKLELSMWAPSESGGCDFEDMEEHSAAPSHPVSLLVKQTKAEIDEVN